MSTATLPPGAAITPGCECWPLPHILAPMNTAHGVQCCDACSPIGFGDLRAAGTLAAAVGGVAKFYDSTGEVSTWAGTADTRMILSDTDPWVEIDGVPVAWAEPEENQR